MPFSASITASLGAAIVLPVLDSTVGLTLASYNVLAIQDGSLVPTPTTTLTMALVELDSVNAPGAYVLTVTPIETGMLTVRLTRGAVTFDYVLVVPVGSKSDPTLEGEYSLTVADGVGPVQGATVRVFDAAGTSYVTRGVTDAQGVATFTLPVGSYQVRAFKSGVDFSAINPTSITVTGTSSAAPVVDSILPTSASVGDTVAIRGGVYDVTSQVWFESIQVTPTSVSPDLKLLLAVVPAGLTGIVVPVKVDKPDPASPPGGKLTSNSITMVVQ